MAKKRHKAEVDRHGASRDLLFHQSHSRYWDWTSVPTRGRGEALPPLPNLFKFREKGPHAPLTKLLHGP